MILLDFILLIILGGFVLYGFRSGLIHMVGSLLGLVLGVYLAGRWYGSFSSWLSSAFHLNPLITQVFAFGLLVFLVNRLIGIAFWFAYKLLGVLRIIPGIGTINRLSGAILGFIEGLLTIGITLFVATKLNVSPAWTETLKNSALVPIFTGISQLVAPLLPGALKSAQSVLTQSVI
ncbi:MAG: CvpA family protein [Candidatus Kerfeldbacteria bacterium]